MFASILQTNRNVSAFSALQLFEYNGDMSQFYELRQSMHTGIHLKNNLAKFHPDPILTLKCTVVLVFVVNGLIV